jgi:uncharacterized protein
VQTFLAVLIGLLFGFVLEKSGAANPEKVINMLRLKDFYLMKVILLAIGLSSFLLFLFMSLGIMSSSHLSVKTSYIGVIFGGGILGLGWAISGYCPGTGLVAAGAGRKDALFYVLGGLCGAFLFTLIYGSIKSNFLFDKIFGGKVTLAATGIKKFSALAVATPGLFVAGVVAAGLIWVAFKLPECD